MGSVIGVSTAGPLDQIVTPEMIKATVSTGLFVANWTWKRRIGPMQNMVDEWLPHRELGTKIPPEYRWLGAGLFLDASTQNNSSGQDYWALIYYETRDDFRRLRKSPAMEPIAKDIAERIHGEFGGDPDFVIYPDQLILVAGDPLPEPEGDDDDIGWPEEPDA